MSIAENKRNFQRKGLSAKTRCLPQRKAVTCRDKMASAERMPFAWSRDKTFFAEKGYYWHIKGVIHKIGYNKK
jgi:hypothetical protein